MIPTKGGLLNNTSAIPGWSLRIYNPKLEVLPEALVEHWTRGWTEVRREHGVKELVPAAEQLQSQDQVLCLRFDGKIAATLCHRFVDLDDGGLYQQSYFKRAWTPSDLQFLLARGGPAVIGSQILVEPEFRGSDQRPRPRDLITFLSFTLLEKLQAKFVIGTMRVNRGMSGLFVKAGAQILRADVAYANENDRVDLVYFDLEKRAFVIPEMHLAQVAGLLSQSGIQKQLDLYGPFFVSQTSLSLGVA